MMFVFNRYRRTNIAEMRVHPPGEDVPDNVSVSDADNPRDGGMVARNPENHNDQWFVAQAYFEANFEPA